MQNGPVEMVDLELEELKREFLTEAQDKVREMQRALDGNRSSETFQRVAYIAHQLKGSGGSYGYQRISSEAAEIERAVESKETSDAIFALIERHVRNLGDEIAARSSELTH